jgi:hypothetical protein
VCVFLELKVSKGVGPNSILPLILTNCASAFVRSLSKMNFSEHVDVMVGKAAVMLDLSENCQSSSAIHTV